MADPLTPPSQGSMAARNKCQRVIKVSADEYLEELKKMYFKTQYIKKGVTLRHGPCGLP